MDLLEEWVDAASRSDYRRLRRRRLAIAHLRASGWTLLQIADAFGIHFSRASHDLTDLKQSVQLFQKEKG